MQLWPLSTGTALRLSVAAIVVLVNALQGQGLRVLPWALLVVVEDGGGLELVARFRTPAAQGLRAHVAERVPQPS